MKSKQDFKGHLGFEMSTVERNKGEKKCYEINSLLE